MDILNSLKRIKGIKSKSKRIGRGIGSGKGGHASSKGMKGQKARSGHNVPNWFEGGQTPMTKRMPYMRGFINHNKKLVVSINISDLEELSKTKKEFSPEVLYKEGLIEIDAGITKCVVKILGRGKIEKGIQFKGFQYSQIAKAKIEKAGGSAN